MAKKQKTFFEKLTEKNYDHDNSKKPKKIQKRNTKAYIVLGLLGLTVVSAITIPLAVATNKINYIDAAAGDSGAVSFVDNKGNKKDITIDDLTSYLKDTGVRNQDKIDALEEQAILYLYEQEVKASKLFQRIWNSSLLDGEKSRTDLALKSLEELRTEQKNKIADIKKNLKVNYGYQNWEKEFQKILQSDQYGKSTNEESAIQHLLINKIKSKALARYTLESSEDSLFDSEDVINRVIKTEVYELDDNGNVVIDAATGQRKVLYNVGDKPFAQYFSKGTNYFDNQNNNSILVFKTKSFDPTKWSNAVKFIDSYLNKNNVYVLSTLSLTGKKPELVTGDWSVDKEKFINMLLYSVNNDNVVKNSTLLNEFKTLSEYTLNSDSDEKDRLIANYRNYLELFSVDSDAIKKTFGSGGVTSVLDLFSNQNPTLLFSTIANIFEKDGAKLPEVDLNSLFSLEFNEATKAEINKLLEQIEAEKAKENADQDVVAELTLQLNTLISSYIRSMSDVQFKELINSIYSKVFVLEKEGKKYFSIAYNIKGIENVKLILSDAGLSILKFTSVQTKDEFDKLLKDDLLNLAANKSAFFNTLSIVNKENTNTNFILDDLLSENEFVEYLKTQDNTTTVTETSSEAQKYTDADIESLKNINKNIFNGSYQKSIATAFTKVNSWVKSLINSQTSWNLKLKDGSYFIDYDKNVSDNISTKDIENTAYDYLQNELAKGEK